jgi:hypothetical protein
LKNFRFLLFVVAFATCVGASTLKGEVQQVANSSSEDAGRRQDTYAVYSQIMSNPPTSFKDDTNTTYAIQAMSMPQASKSAQQTGGIFELLAKFGDPCVEPPLQYESRWKEVVTEYDAGSPSVPLERSLSIAKPYVFLTPDLDSTKLKGVRDIFRLTNVFFNKDRTLALAGVGTSGCGTLCGHFQWLIFEKTSGGGWKTVPPIKSCSIDA